MKTKKNPTGIRVRAFFTPANTIEQDPSDITPMRVEGGKRVHILNPNTVVKLPTGQVYQGNALCGAGYPSFRYPYGSGEVIKPAEIIKGNARQGSVTVDCYRCLKIHAINTGPTFDRSFLATVPSHRTPHQMLPGGREGFYGEELEQTRAMEEEVLQAQVELAAVDRDYWDEQQDLWKVGPPIARTQPGAIEFAERLGTTDEETGRYPITRIVPKRPKPNPAFKVGDRVSEKGRLGKITALHTKGTADVLFDDMDFAIRRQMPSLMKVKANGVESEIQRMINNAPPSWKAMFKEKVGKVKPTLNEAINAILKLTPSGNEYGPTGSRRWAVPPAVKAQALKGVRLSFRENYTSASGIGLARAMQLATWPKVWDRSINRMYSYFDRHISDTESATFGNDANPSRGWIAWLNWGGTPGYEWAAAIKGSTRKIMHGERGYDRRKRVTQSSKAMSTMANPRNKKYGVLYEKYDPKMAQRNAVVQGIYETLVRNHLGLPWNKAFKDSKGVRLDQSSMMAKPTISKLLGQSFAISTRTGQKHGYLKKGTQDPTAKGIARAKERAKDKKHLEENIIDYETTLSMARKEPFRIVERTVNKKKRYYVMPLGKYRTSLEQAVNLLKTEEAKLKRLPPARKKPSKSKRKKPRRSANPLQSAADGFVRPTIQSYMEDLKVMVGGKEVTIGVYERYLLVANPRIFRSKDRIKGYLRGLERSPFFDTQKGAVDTDADLPEEEFILREFEKKGAEKRWQPTNIKKEGSAKPYASILLYWYTNNLTEHDKYKNQAWAKGDPEKWSKYVPLRDLLAWVVDQDIADEDSGGSGLWFDRLGQLIDLGIITKGDSKPLLLSKKEMQLDDGGGLQQRMLNTLSALERKRLIYWDEDNDVIVPDALLYFDLPKSTYDIVEKPFEVGKKTVIMQVRQPRGKTLRVGMRASEIGAGYTTRTFDDTYGEQEWITVVKDAIKVAAKKKKVSLQEYEKLLSTGKARLTPAQLYTFTFDSWLKVRVFIEKAAWYGHEFRMGEGVGAPFRLLADYGKYIDPPVTFTPMPIKYYSGPQVPSFTGSQESGFDPMLGPAPRKVKHVIKGVYTLSNNPLFDSLLNLPSLLPHISVQGINIGKNVTKTGWYNLLTGRDFLPKRQQEAAQDALLKQAKTAIIFFYDKSSETGKDALKALRSKMKKKNIGIHSVDLSASENVLDAREVKIGDDLRADKVDFVYPLFDEKALGKDKYEEMTNFLAEILYSSIRKNPRRHVRKRKATPKKRRRVIRRKR